MSGSDNEPQEELLSPPPNVTPPPSPPPPPRPGDYQEIDPDTNEGKGLRRGGLQSLHSFVFPEKGQFDDWTKSQLVEALIADGQVIRDEQYLSKGVLKSFADAVFLDRDPPPKPPLLTAEEENKRHTAALTIQNAYFAWMISSMETTPSGAPAAPLMHDVILRAMHATDHDKSDGGERQQPLPSTEHAPPRQMYSREMNSGTQDELDIQRELGDDDLDDSTAVQNTILEEEFIPPSLEYAMLYADFNHPRIGGLGGKLMPWLRTSTGRHCVSGSWGEQCDMFEERQVSELGRYGPGITNYFKFLKWSFWIFVFLSAMWFPVLVLNTFGAGENQSAQLNDLAQTMVGNLGDTNRTKTLHLPGCTGSVRGQDCELDKEVVAQYYAFTDLIAVIVVIIGYLWLRYFEVKEAKLLDKNSLSAANYTIAVKGFDTSQEVTESDLKKHFKTVTGQDVAAVFIAYDNEREIELYKKRGDLMMARLRCTREYQYYRSKERAGLSPISQEKKFEILANRVEITSSIREVDRETAKCQNTTDKPLYAFITFENAIAARLAVRAYNKSIWGYLRMKRSLQYKKARLSVAAASEPSTIIWENLKYAKIDRGKRRIVSTVISLILLAISAIANIIARGLEQNASSAGGDEFCPDGFFSLSAEEQQAAVDKNEDLLHCYCDQFSFSEQTGDSYCSKYARQNLVADLFVYLAAFVVLCTNGAISLFLSRISAHYEKHHSQDSMEKSIFHRMFILKLINMGILFLTMNFWVSYLEQMGIVYESTQNFSTQWYKTIGVSMTLVQGGNIFGPHLYKFFFFRRAKKKRQEAIDDPIHGGLTQIDLNKLFLGPDFLVAHRYAQNLADFYICFIFCAGMPILPIIAIFNFYTTYWVDKFLFLNYYRSPPRYKTNIGRSATALIPYAIVLHLVASIWMLGNKDIFHAGSEDVPVGSFIESWNMLNIHAKVTQRHTYPLFVLLVIVLVGVLLGQVAEQIFGCISSTVKTCFGTCIAKSEFYQEIEQYMFNTITIPYSRAVRRGIIKGLVNYNILQNPKYKEAFAITDVFALNHTRVKSLRHFEKLSFDDVITANNEEGLDSSNPPTDIASVGGGKGRRRSKGGHQNPETLRLMNASLEMANVSSKPAPPQPSPGGLEQIQEEPSQMNMPSTLSQPPPPLQPPPSVLGTDRSSRPSYGRVPYQDDDDVSVMSSSSAVTRVTGVLMMDDNDTTSLVERPHSAVLDMGSTFRPGSMEGMVKPSGLHDNPMVDPVSKKKKKSSRPSDASRDSGSMSSGGSKRAAKLTPADQKRIDEFKEGKTKRSNFMNSGKM